MRLWTLHPKYLDSRGLVALWREALLAQKVLAGATVGYRFHPQLQRFRAHPQPEAAIAAYLLAVHAEAAARGYRFDAAKISANARAQRLVETEGQLLYEWQHLKTKLRDRDPQRWASVAALPLPEAHPSFILVPGPVQDWERRG